MAPAALLLAEHARDVVLLLQTDAARALPGVLRLAAYAPRAPTERKPSRTAHGHVAELVKGSWHKLHRAPAPPMLWNGIGLARGGKQARSAPNAGRDCGSLAAPGFGALPADGNGELPGPDPFLMGLLTDIF